MLEARHVADDLRPLVARHPLDAPRQVDPLFDRGGLATDQDEAGSASWGVPRELGIQRGAGGVDDALP
jgi:hypothetical protein